MNRNSHVLSSVKIAASVDFGVGNDPSQPRNIHFHAVPHNSEEPPTLVKSAGTTDFKTELIYDLHRNMGYGIIATDSYREYHYLFFVLELPVLFIDSNKKEYASFYEEAYLVYDKNDTAACPKPRPNRNCPAYYRSWMLAKSIEKFNASFSKEMENQEVEIKEYPFILKGGKYEFQIGKQEYKVSFDKKPDQQIDKSHTNWGNETWEAVAN